jgi:hypothetical protein
MGGWGGQAPHGCPAAPAARARGCGGRTGRADAGCWRHTMLLLMACAGMPASCRGPQEVWVRKWHWAARVPHWAGAAGRGAAARRWLSPVEHCSVMRRQVDSLANGLTWAVQRSLKRAPARRDRQVAACCSHTPSGRPKIMRYDQQQVAHARCLPGLMFGIVAIAGGCVCGAGRRPVGGSQCEMPPNHGRLGMGPPK